MYANHPLICRARQCALAEFDALAVRMLEGVERVTVTGLRPASARQRSILSGARGAAIAGAPVLRTRLNAVYAAYLERAVQTMYVNLRPSLDSITIDALALIDDESVDRQIEVVRLTAALRDADPVSLGHLNAMVSRLHGDTVAKERENPFRPYLLARTLHDAVAEVILEPGQAALVFELLSCTMPAAASSFYQTVCKAFEAGGMQTGLQVSTRVSRTPFPVQAAPDPSPFAPPTASPVLSPDSGLTPLGPIDPWNQLLALMQQALPPDDFTNHGGGASAQPQALLNDAVAGWIKDSIQKILSHPGASLPETCRLSRLRRLLPPAAVSEAADALIDLTGKLFDLIGCDDALPLAMQQCLVRLELPFLQAALQNPALLASPGHPLRQLMSRIGSISTGLVESSAVGGVILEEIEQAVLMLLDAHVRSAEHAALSCVARLDQRLAERLPVAEPSGAACVAAIGSLQDPVRRQAAGVLALKEILAPLGIETETASVLAAGWSRILVPCKHSSTASQAQQVQDIGQILEGQARLLIELVWSLQPKSGEAERSILLQRLPALVKRFQDMLQQSGIPREEVQSTTQRLTVAYSKVLKAPFSRAPAIDADALRRQIVAVSQHCAGMPADGAFRAGAVVTRTEVAASFAACGLTAELHMDELPPETAGLPPVAIELGTSAACQSGAADIAVRLVWTSEDRRFYMFLPEFGGAPILFADDALRHAIDRGILEPHPPLCLLQRAAAVFAAPTPVRR